MKMLKQMQLGVISLNRERKGDSGKLIGLTSLSIILIFFIGGLFTLPSIIQKSKENARNEVLDNMKKIHTAAVIVDEIDVGIEEDVDNKGKYLKLSETAGFRVYNQIQDKKYSVYKDPKTKEITVNYGKDIQYPDKKFEKDFQVEGKDSVSIEDLFTFDESNGKVILTGFSSVGLSLLESNSVIQIPSSYKGRDVVEIADNAFYNKKITGTVIIPESIEKIGNNAFSNNGPKGVSENISKPHAGSWKVKEKKWINN